MTNISQERWVEIQLLGKAYRVTCEAHESEVLQRCVETIEAKMQALQKSGKVVGMERIATMAALNIAHELVDLRDEFAQYQQTIDGQLLDLQQRIDDALLSK